MANYFVDNDFGNDGNSGTTIALAWKTFGRPFLSTSPIVGGDIVFFKPGYYRYNEAGWTGDIAMTSPSSEVSFIGDYNGQYFNKIGNVVASFFTNAGTSNVSEDFVFAQRKNLTFKNIHFKGGVTRNPFINLDGSGVSTVKNIKFINCSFNSGNAGIRVTAASNAADPVFNLLIDGCFFNTVGVAFSYTAVNTSAVYDVGITIQNSVFFKGNIQRNNNYAAGATVFAGGLNLYNNTFMQTNSFTTILIQSGAGTSSNIIKSKVYNNVFINTRQPFDLSTSSVEGDYNKFLNTNTNSNLYTNGPNDQVNGFTGIDFFGAALSQSVNLLFGMPLLTNYISSQGNSNPATSIIMPLNDIMNKSRPNINNGTNTSISIGAFEISNGFKLPSHPSITGQSRGWATERDKLNN